MYGNVPCHCGLGLYILPVVEDKLVSPPGRGSVCRGTVSEQQLHNWIFRPVALNACAVGHRVTLLFRAIMPCRQRLFVLVVTNITMQEGIFLP